MSEMNIVTIILVFVTFCNIIVGILGQQNTFTYASVGQQLDSNNIRDSCYRLHRKVGSIKFKLETFDVWCRYKNFKACWTNTECKDMYITKTSPDLLPDQETDYVKLRPFVENMSTQLYARHLDWRIREISKSLLRNEENNERSLKEPNRRCLLDLFGTRYRGCHGCHGCYACRTKPKPDPPTPGPTPGSTPGPTPGPTPEPTPEPTPSPTPSPTPRPFPTPGPCTGACQWRGKCRRPCPWPPGLYRWKCRRPYPWPPGLCRGNYPRRFPGPLVPYPGPWPRNKNNKYAE